MLQIAIQFHITNLERSSFYLDNVGMFWRSDKRILLSILFYIDIKINILYNILHNS